MRALRKAGQGAQAGAAWLAAVTAWLTSAAPAIATKPLFSPVAGLNTDEVRPPCPTMRLPPIKCGVWQTITVSFDLMRDYVIPRNAHQHEILRFRCAFIKVKE